MDDFVCNKLTQWDLSEWTELFKVEGIDKECLYCLDDQEIANLIPKVGPRAKFKKRLKLLKKEQKATDLETVHLSAQVPEEAADSSQVGPSTSGLSDKGKRKLDLQGESSKWQSPTTKRRRDTRRSSRSYKDKMILSDVKNIMSCICTGLHTQTKTKLNDFLTAKISDLKTDKKEVIGVFGKTGSGKSSLINAIIEEENLLPSGRLSACTSVMIKVEANTQNSKYEADIEFITKEDWKEELWSLNFLGDNAGQEEEDDDYHDTVEKLSALHGAEWKNKLNENPMDNKYFNKEIPEFLNSTRKILTCESAKDLSAKLVKYTRSDSEEEEGKEVKRRYWPLVKCVTVRVPKNDLLQHVTLVDLPGNGDRNKSRDKMWKGFVGSCSTVWIVADINRAIAEKETWDILKSACSLMGNGGECQQIHFICTKSDLVNASDNQSAAALILKENKQAKDKVYKEFSNLHKVKKHFSDDCFKVFTVSSTEFLKQTHLNPDETEIPKLQGFLQNLNDCHSETLNYVFGAYGILSLIQGARCREGAAKQTDVCTDLEKNVRRELDKVRKPTEEAYKAFEKCLIEGVKESKRSCEKALHLDLYPIRSGRGFHRILKCVVKNKGTYKPKKGKQINLNEKLATYLTDSIDEEFRKTFPNEAKCRPFNGVISTFSLDTEKLIDKYKDVELQLTFLKTEVKDENDTILSFSPLSSFCPDQGDLRRKEEKMKTLLHKYIREYKKTIYSSLTTKIEETMQECYERAADFSGQETLRNMRDTVEKHVHESKNTMFEQTKDIMLSQMTCLKEYILRTLEETMQESIDLSLKTDGASIPDVKMELVMVKKYYNELKGSPDETSLTWFARWRETAEA